MLPPRRKTGDVMAVLALAPANTWSLGDILIAIVILAAVVGIVYLALQYFGVPIPGIVVKIFWIVVVCVIAVLAIRFLLAL